MQKSTTRRNDRAVPSPRQLKILSVVGARPNFVKISPLLREMARHPELTSFLVHTGQHYDVAMSRQFFQDLSIPLPDVNLEVGSGSHGEQTAEIMKRVEPVLQQQRPDCVLVVGDVNSTFACAYVAKKLGLTVAHVEAGLRSFDRSMPEEINRILTDAIADYFFVTEPSAIRNLRREGAGKDRIFWVGNTMIDSLKRTLPLAQSTDTLQVLGLVNSRLRNRAEPYAVLTLHRPSNVDDPEILAPLLSAVREIADRIPVIFPVHPRTAMRLGLEPAPVARGSSSGSPSGLQVIPPLGYLEFIHLLSRATLVITDSGGIQEETTFLGIPCLTVRENTERPITVTQGTNFLVGRDPAVLCRKALALLGGKALGGKALGGKATGGKATGDKARSRRIPRFWDGRASQRIVRTLLRLRASGSLGRAAERENCVPAG